MKAGVLKQRTCPMCGRAYTEEPALSRKDNKTLICSDCGTRQALESMGVNKEGQKIILDTIHKYRNM